MEIEKKGLVRENEPMTPCQDEADYSTARPFVQAIAVTAAGCPLAKGHFHPNCQTPAAPASVLH